MTKEYKLYYQRHLPHYQPLGATLFLTFRLAGSLPLEIIRRLQEDVQRKEFEIQQIDDPKAHKEATYLAQKQMFGKLDAELDFSQNGPRWLSELAIAQMANDAIHYRDGKAYTLEAFCIMPNHVHMVFTPLVKDENPYSLSEIMQSLKRYTARQANQLLGREGDFWQHESYDHVVRDNAEFERIVYYVLNNPTKAGLKSRWLYRKG